MTRNEDGNEAIPASEKSSEAQAGVDSAEIAVGVLLALARLGGGQTLTALAAACGLPPPRAHRYLVSLVRTGVIERDSARRYWLGPAVLEIGLNALASVDAIGVANDAMVSLRDELNQATALMVWGQSGPIIVRAEDSLHPVSVRLRVGQTLPVLTSASGLLLAAHLPWEKVRPAIEAELECSEVHSSGDAPTSLDAVRSMFVEIKQRGMSRIVDALTPRVSAFAAPIFDGTGQVVMSMSVVAPSGEFDTNWHSAVARELKQTCDHVSSRLGYQPASKAKPSALST